MTTEVDGKHSAWASNRTAPFTVTRRRGQSTTATAATILSTAKAARTISAVTSATSLPMSVTQPPRLDVDLEAVRKQVDEKLALYDRRCAEGDDGGDEDDDPPCDPVVVFDDVSPAEFDEWLSDNEGDLRRWQYEPSEETEGRGRVVVYSLPSNVHESTAGVILDRVKRQVQVIGNDFFLSDSLRLEASPKHFAVDRNQEPDVSLTPADLDPFAFPTFIVEVSYKNESFPGLMAKLYRWMGPDTTVQVTIGVRVGKAVRRLVLMRRNHESNGNEDERLIVQTFDFEAGQTHHVAFPVSELYVGGTLPPALVGHENDEIVIDLPELLALINARTQ